MNTVAIITAAGQGKRMGIGIKKPYVILGGKPIIAHAILPFELSNFINEIIILTAEGDEEYCLKKIVKKFGFRKVLRVVKGGKERQDSVMSGVLAAGNNWDMIVVHDGVRPFIEKDMIEKLLKSASKHGAAVLAVPVKDTIKQASSGFVKKTFRRDQLWAVQTPQAFRFKLLKKAHEIAKKQCFIGTDDAVLVERLGFKIAIINGSYNNIKITTPEDLVLGKAILRHKK